jgi:hypothetical protein
MPTIEIDDDAREILRSWKKTFAKNGKCLDYSESIRYVNDKYCMFKKVKHG